VAALERANDQDLAIHPGQDVRYVVVDDEKSSRERVVLAHEAGEDYDPHYYETQLIRAIGSILSPLGWDREDIERHLDGTDEVTITSYQS
jgi:DNA polymerase I